VAKTVLALLIVFQITNIVLLCMQQVRYSRIIKKLNSFQTKSENRNK